MQSEMAYQQVRQFVMDNGVPFREMEHEPEGRTDLISMIRGNELAQAAKAVVVMAKTGKHSRRYYLAVVPGDKRVDMNAIKRLNEAEHVLFAPEDRAMEMTHCMMGAVPPVSFDENLRLVVDAGMMEHTEIVFNAGRLDLSMFVPPKPFFDAANAMVTNIAM